MQIKDLTPDPENANKGTQRGEALLEKSISSYGLGRSILIDKNNRIIAGNKTAQKAGELGIDEVTVVDTTGSEVVAVRRTDLDAETDKEARELAYYDNQTSALSLDWDASQMLQDVEAGLNLPFTDEEVAKFTESELPFYSEKVETPLYEPSDEKPSLHNLFDKTRVEGLVKNIRSSDIPEDEKDFLILAAGRHARLNFQLIADYYAHSDKETQELMEDNALVIVDFNKAIENGWARLSGRVDVEYEKTNAE